MAYWGTDYLNPYGSTAKKKPKVDFLSPIPWGFWQIPWVNAPSPIQNIVSQAQQNPQLQQSFQQAFAPQPQQPQIPQPTAQPEMQQAAGPQKISVDDFAQKIKDKYPDYAEIDNVELTNKMIAKYPEYADKVEMNIQEPQRETFGQQLKGDAQRAWAGIVWLTQGISDIGQWLIGKPVEFLAKNTLKLFGFSDEELEGFSTKWDITPILWEQKDSLLTNVGRETGKILGSAALTAWMPIGPALTWLWGKELLKAVVKRSVMWAAEWVWSTAAYNLWSSWEAGSPVNLWVAGGIWAAIWGPLSLIWSKLIAPGIAKVAEKLQLSWLLNKARIERLQTILKQWWSDDLANWTTEDVANWMFQRDIKWSKPQIINKLTDIENASMDLLDDTLTASTTKHKPEILPAVLDSLKQEYAGGISQGIKNKEKIIDDLITKYGTEWLTLKEINWVKRMINSDLSPYAASWKVKLAKEDLAAANRELKNFVEDAITKEWLAPDWLWVKLLNNEYAMASSMKKAISEKHSSDVIGEILSFVNNRWWSSLAGWLIWSQAGPFDSNSIEGKVWNIIFGFAVGRFIGSTQAKTFVASLLKKMSSTQKAEILNYINKWGKEKISDKTSKVLLDAFNKVDDDISVDNSVYDNAITPGGVKTPIAQRPLLGFRQAGSAKNANDLSITNQNGWITNEWWAKGYLWGNEWGVKNNTQQSSIIAEDNWQNWSNTEKGSRWIDDFIESMGGSKSLVDEADILEAIPKSDIDAIKTMHPKITDKWIVKIYKDFQRDLKKSIDIESKLDARFKEDIRKLNEEEQRIGKVGKNKVNKEYQDKQMREWERKKERLLEVMQQEYGGSIDRYDANQIVDKFDELQSMK